MFCSLRKIGITLALLSAFLGIVGVRPVSALSIAPALFEVQGLPGETKTITIQITNDENQPVQIVPQIQKFLPLGTEGQQQFLPPTDVSGLPTWTYIDGVGSWLQPAEKRNITIELRLPTDAPNGGQYEAIFFSTQAVTAGSEKSGFRSRVGALVLLTIGDPKASRLQVTNWQLLGAGTREALDGAVQVTLRNTGVTHIAPTGTVMVRNVFGTLVKQIALNPVNGRILPTSDRSFTVALGQDNTIGTGFWAGVLHEVSAFGLGPYTVTLEGVERLDQSPAPLRLAVFPWRLLVVFLVVVMVIVGLLRWYRSRLIRRWHERAD